MSQAALLAQGIANMGLAVSDEAQQKLLAYLALLQKWNKVYNLTAVRDPLEMVTLHLLDSLSVLPYVNSKNILDVGSGGGLPGIVLAICKPELQVTTIDTVQKKVIFMRQVKGELGLENLTPVHARVENFKPDAPFEIVISRASSFTSSTSAPANSRLEGAISKPPFSLLTITSFKVFSPIKTW